MKIKFSYITLEIFRLFAKIGNWFRTNWKKIIIKTENFIIGESIIYENGCWNCKTPIRSVKTTQGFRGRFGSRWFGNKKCPKPGCNYFICKKCGKCLCESPDYGSKKGMKPFYRIEKKWVKENTQTKEI